MKKKVLLGLLLSIIISSFLFPGTFAATCSDSSHHCSDSTGGNHSQGSTCSHNHASDSWVCHTCAETTGTGSIGWERKRCTSNSDKRMKNKTREHSYGSSCGTCGASGVRCTGCGHHKKHSCVQPHTHSYSYSYSVTATCQHGGYDVYVCSCGATENRNATSTVGHNYAWTSNDSNHWQYCTYNCGTTRNSGGHSGSWSSNASQHWKDCSTCGRRINAAANHSASSTYSQSATQHWKVCTVCGYITTAKANHGESGWQTDASQHWKKCTTCGYITTAKANHVPSGWQTDASQHWKKCNTCGYITTAKANHVDNDKNGLCDTCNYRMYYIVAVPSAATGLVYNGSSQTGVPSGTGYTITDNTATNAGNYTATLTLAANYRWTGAVTGTKTVAWSIAKKAATNPTLTAYNAQYDGSAHTIGVSGGEGGEIQYSTNNSTWSTTKPTRTNYGTTTVYVRRAENTNYKATSAISSTITINKRSIAVVWGTTTTFTYNNTQQAPTASASSGVSGQTLVITRTTQIDAGNYTSTASLSSVTGGDVNNYTLTNTTKAYTINKKSVAVSWGSTTTFTYNNSQQAPTASAASGVTGETLNITRTTAIDAGNYTSTASLASVSGGRANVNNYTLTNTTKAFTINKKSVAVVWGGTSFTYNNSQQAPTASADSGVTGETLNILRTTAINAGTYTSTASLSSVTGGQAKVTNYTLTNTTKQFTIAKKSVAAVWDATTSFTYNGAAQAPEVSASSGVTGEILNLTRTTGVDVGSYTSTASIASVSGGQAKVDNYTLTNTTKAFTINKRNITITADNKSKTYGDNNPTFTVTIGATGVSGQVGAVSGAPTTSATKYTNIGNYDITQGNLALANNGTFKASNYNMVFVKGTLTINAATPSIVLADKRVVYNLRPQTIDPPVVTGVSGGTTPAGAITYVYYVDAACTQLTTPENSGAASNGAPPVWAGTNEAGGTTYYVKATIAAQGNYTANTSAAKTLYIECATMTGYVSIGGQNSAGYTLTVDTRGISPEGTTRTYKYYANNSQTTSGGNLVKDGGSDSTYLVRPEDSGKFIYVVVTAVKFNYYTKDFYAVMINSIDNSGPSIGELVVINAVGDKIIGSETMLEIKDCYDPSGIGGYEWQFKGEDGEWITVKDEDSSESHSELTHQIPNQGSGSYRVIVRDIHGNTTISNVVTVYFTFDRRPTIRFETSQTGTDEVIISVTVKSVTALAKVTVNTSEISSTLNVSKINNEFTTTFDYRALINGAYLFEVIDELGNIANDTVNISTLSTEGASITYEIRSATAVSNAEIVFRASELVRIMAPDTYDGITFDSTDFATIITATIPVDLEFGQSRTFRFQSKSYRETEVTVYGPILTGIEYLRFIRSEVPGMNVTLARAYALASGISSLQIYVDGSVQSYYGMSMSNALRPITTLATSDDLDVIKILGNAGKTEVLSGSGKVVELESVSGISPVSNSDYTNGNATGVRKVTDSTLSTYVSGSSLEDATTYDTFRVKLVP